MEHSEILSRSTLSGRLMIAAGAVVGSVVLPQLVHMVGAFSGLGSALGEALLPMHFFVILAGFLAGPVAGVLAGGLAPILSYALSGMPTEAMLPFIMLELLGYGLLAGLLANRKMNNLAKLILIQLGGRMLRSLAVIFAVYAIHASNLPVSSIWNSVRIGLPGILLQWCILPLLLYRIERMERPHE